MPIASRLIAVVGLGLVVGTGGEVRATTVTYSDSGHFTTDQTGPNSITITSGNLTVTIEFDGVASHSLSAPADDTLGIFSVTATGGSANVNTEGRFFLDINQTSPLAATGFFSATLAGSVKFSPEKNAVIEFDQTSIRLPSSNGVTYTLLGLTGSAPNTLVLDTPKSSGTTATTLLRARIDDSGVINNSPVVAAPEPSTLAMGGLNLALLGLGYAWRRRKALSA